MFVGKALSCATLFASQLNIQLVIVKAFDHGPELSKFGTSTYGVNTPYVEGTGKQRHITCIMPYVAFRTLQTLVMVKPVLSIVAQGNTYRGGSKSTHAINSLSHKHRCLCQQTSLRRRHSAVI